jgi:hypothetical protein
MPVPAPSPQAANSVPAPGCALCAGRSVWTAALLLPFRPHGHLLLKALAVRRWWESAVWVTPARCGQAGGQRPFAVHQLVHTGLDGVIHAAGSPEPKQQL